MSFGMEGGEADDPLNRPHQRTGLSVVVPAAKHWRQSLPRFSAEKKTTAVFHQAAEIFAFEQRGAFCDAAGTDAGR